ncbi:MAG: glutathione S-transferase N-terminal domain-containing protein [Pseudomonadota bacterium]
MGDTIKIWGRKTSSNVQSVMWMVAELGLDHERKDVGGKFGGNDTPDYLAMNPNGLVPVLQDGDLVLFESHAIVRYLARQYGEGRLCAADPAGFAAEDKWLEWAKTTVYPPLIPGIFWSLIRTPAAMRDMDRLASDVSAVQRLARIADTQLSSTGFMCGNALSIADIGFGGLLYRYFTLEFEREELPALSEYYQKLIERPGYREHVMIDYSELKAPDA